MRSGLCVEFEDWLWICDAMAGMDLRYNIFGAVKQYCERPTVDVD